MSATKGVFQFGPRKKKTVRPRMECCGSTHRSIHLSECPIRNKKPKIDPRKEKVQELKAKGFLSQEVAYELRISLADVNKLWI